MNAGPNALTEFGLAAAPSLGEFPFECELSLAPLIAFWEEVMAREGSSKGILGRALQAQLRDVPELARPIQDLSILAAQRDLVETLMTAIFPPAFWDRQFGAALVPFRLQRFYATPSFERTLMGPDGTLRGRLSDDGRSVATTQRLSAYALILRRAYGIPLEIEYPLVFTVLDEETGLERHFKMHIDWDFLAVEPVGELPPLPPQTLQRVRVSLPDLETLRALLPPDRFRFRGFTVFRAVEVTDQEVLSALKRDLIDKESLISRLRLDGLQDRLRTLFRRPDLRFGLAALAGDRVLALHAGGRIEHQCIFADSTHHQLADLAGSLYEQAIRQGRPQLIEDLAAQPQRTGVEDRLLRSGIRNLVVAPLVYGDTVIGCLELGSPQPGALNSAIHGPKLQEVLPLFAMAVKRSMEELNTRIQAAIKERCTAIHPVVEWRFRQAVLKGLKGLAPGAAPGDLEPIVFPEVYPLYALTDIRGSSTHRAEAIQADLLAQLALAREVLLAAHAARPLPILRLLTQRLDRKAAQIAGSLRSGDEVSVLAFLRREIEPLFELLHAFGPALRQIIAAYRAPLDPQHGAVYRRRQAFEESVALVNETISAYLDAEEQAAQLMFPHYFAKRRTDGVDYSIYVGASLLEHGGFHPLYLRNLRLWQLLVACGIARRVEGVKARLPVPLETTNLILAHATPLALRFRFDEKQFDVDGAYDLRYEIIKKRIDKAGIRGTQERLTQPGKVAIVYSHPSEATEYREYLAYLQRQGALTGEIEDLELEELQGVPGLRALRVGVDLVSAPDDTAPLLAAATAGVAASGA